MRNKIYIGIGLAISLSLFSCDSEKKEVVGPFTDVIDMKKEMENNSSSLVKRVYGDDKIESKSVTSPNWEVELKPFVDANFNKPANKEKYTRVEQSSELSDWREVTWKTNEPNLPVYEAIFRYQDTLCVGGTWKVKKTSSAYEMVEDLTYLPGVGYSIDNQQDLSKISEQSFYLSGEFEGCSQPWRMFFDIGDQNIPVNFWLTVNGEDVNLKFTQGKESFDIKVVKTDSGYMAEMPVFQSYLLFQMNDDEMQGNFHNLDKGLDYIIPFSANKLPYDQVYAFNADPDINDFMGKWETYFYEENGDSSAAIGMFERFGDDLIGTFATETGDYRFLQGKVIGNEFSLSTFDGSHLFLFTGIIQGNIIVNGHFYSGSHYHATWKAKRNDDFKLIDPNTMTSLKEGEEKVAFSFPNIEGDMVSLTDEKFEDKVVIIQILGSWCPNCMDETRYFVELYNEYNVKGLEIIGLGFERSENFEKAKNALSKAISDLDVPYSVLIAGTPRESAKALPMITPIKSYPTSIFLNKKGEVVKIHTGFYGPSTGKFYDDYRNETESFIQELLKE